MDSCATPDLHIGTIFASFCSVGNTPVWNDRLLKEF